jgi:hypothetical protein
LKQVPATSWPKGATQAERDAVETLRRTDEAYAKKDVTAYSALTASNYLRINADGTETSRDAFLKQVAGTPEMKRDTPNLSDFHVRVWGPIAVVTWVNKSINGIETGLRRSRVFVREGNAWKQLVSHDTLVGAPQ